jgi:hypothetical protein
MRIRQPLAETTTRSVSLIREDATVDITSAYTSHGAPCRSSTSGVVPPFPTVTKPAEPGPQWERPFQKAPQLLKDWALHRLVRLSKVGTLTTADLVEHRHGERVVLGIETTEECQLDCLRFGVCGKQAVGIQQSVVNGGGGFSEHSQLG